MDERRLSQLLEDYFDGTLASGDKLELEQMLLQYPAARERFWESGSWEALYDQWGGEHWGREGLKLETAIEPAPAVVRPVPFFQRIIAGPWLIPLSAAAVITVLATWALYQLLPRSVEYRDVATATVDPRGSGVAVLRHVAGAVWEEGTPQRGDGATLEPGWLKLKSGMAAIDFFSGARVIIEGPAELELQSGSEAFCQSGRLRAEVPPQAHGFTIKSSRFSVVDLGTAFGLQVSQDGSGQVKVLQGKVELRQGAKVLPMKAGSAATVDSVGVVADATVSDAVFPSEDELQQLSEVATEQRRREWRSGLDEVGVWPGLVAQFAFEPQSTWDPVLRNRVPGGTDGAIVGARWTGGRWARKSGLEFQSGSDRVRVDAPGEFESMSFAAWVRVDALENPYSSLLMSDGDVPGAVHWGIKQPGAMTLDVWPLVGPRQECDSGVVFSPGRGSEWMHLAVVIDAASRQVQHFVNGQLAGTAPFIPTGPMRVGRAEIGNWNDGTGKSTYSIRNLNGRVDELDVFGRALTNTEIMRLWMLGRTESGEVRQ